MSKKSNISKLTTFLALALSHKIGGIVNLNEIYATKYNKEYENYFNQAKEIAFEENFNLYDKSQIKIILKRKLNNELTRKDFIDNRKYTLIDEEVNKVLLSLNLS